MTPEIERAIQEFASKREDELIGRMLTFVASLRTPAKRRAPAVEGQKKKSPARKRPPRKRAPRPRKPPQPPAAPAAPAAPAVDVEAPEYLRSVEGLSDELARLAEESDTRDLSRAERKRLDRGIAAAKLRVNAAREARDGQ